MTPALDSPPCSPKSKPSLNEMEMSDMSISTASLDHTDDSAHTAGSSSTRSADPEPPENPQMLLRQARRPTTHAFDLCGLAFALATTCLAIPSLAITAAVGGRKDLTAAPTPCCEEGGAAQRLAFACGGLVLGLAVVGVPLLAALLSRVYLFLGCVAYAFVVTGMAVVCGWRNVCPVGYTLRTTDY
ncbi:hypothetical protein MBLNU459_g8314t1 [Dothideomycetes sp. NU459]